jgi:hypothetical protein
VQQQQGHALCSLHALLEWKQQAHGAHTTTHTTISHHHFTHTWCTWCTHHNSHHHLTQHCTHAPAFDLRCHIAPPLAGQWYEKAFHTPAHKKALFLFVCVCMCVLTCTCVVRSHELGVPGLDKRLCQNPVEGNRSHLNGTSPTACAKFGSAGFHVCCFKLSLTSAAFCTQVETPFVQAGMHTADEAKAGAQCRVQEHNQIHIHHKSRLATMRELTATACWSPGQGFCSQVPFQSIPDNSFCAQMMNTEKP